MEAKLASRLRDLVADLSAARFCDVERLTIFSYEIHELANHGREFAGWLACLVTGWRRKFALCATFSSA